MSTLWVCIGSIRINFQVFTFWVVVKESAVFTVDPSAGFSSVYGTDPHANPGLALSMMAKQVLCPIYCLTHTLIYMRVIAIVSMRYVR